jgi:hypothetical protein
MRSVYRKGELDMRILAIALAAVTLLSGIGRGHDFEWSWKCRGVGFGRRPLLN